MAELDAVLSSISKAHMSHREQRRLHAVAVRAAVHGPPLLPQPCCGTEDSAALHEVQRIVDLVGRSTGQTMNVGQAVRRLRDMGVDGAALAKRLQRLSKVRNLAAHPDKEIVADVEAMLWPTPASKCQTSGTSRCEIPSSPSTPGLDVADWYQDDAPDMSADEFPADVEEMRPDASVPGCVSVGLHPSRADGTDLCHDQCCQTASTFLNTFVVGPDHPHLGDICALLGGRGFRSACVPVMQYLVEIRGFLALAESVVDDLRLHSCALFAYEVPMGKVESLMSVEHVENFVLRYSELLDAALVAMSHLAEDGDDDMDELQVNYGDDRAIENSKADSGTIAEVAPDESKVQILLRECTARQLEIVWATSRRMGWPADPNVAAALARKRCAG